MQKIHLFLFLASIPSFCHLGTILSMNCYPDALEEAILQQESLDSIQLIASSGVDINALDASGSPLLPKILRKETSPEVISLVLNAGANPNLRTTRGLCPLSLCIWRNLSHQVISLLLEKGADPNFGIKHPGLGSRGHLSPLRLALHRKAPIETVSALLEAGANPSEVDPWKDSLPIIALERGAPDQVVELLFEKCPPIDVDALSYFTKGKLIEQIITMQKRIAKKKKHSGV